MPTIRRPLEADTELVSNVDESLGATPESAISHYLQTTPVPSGPESAELSKIMADVRRSLEQLATIYPFLGTAYDPLLAIHGYAREASGPVFDYEHLPSVKTVSVKAKFFVRGRGKPRAYSLEDE